MPIRSASLLVAAAALAAAAGTVLLPAGPAGAAACADDTGVTVVVDFHELGGGVQQRCDADGSGKTAAQLFTDNGFALTYVQRQPGFVCRVSGKPADDACVNTPPADAYWGLFVADGSSATWSYASQGVGSLTLDDGESVAFSWQGSSDSSPPRVAPRTDAVASPTPTPTPTPSPSQSPTRTGSPTPAPSPSAVLSSAASPSASAVESPSSKPSRSRRPATPTPSETPSAVATPTPTATPAPPPATTSGEPGDGVPGWVVGAVLVGLAGAGGATAYARRRGRPAP